jgi:hypothetical protein
MLQKSFAVSSPNLVDLLARSPVTRLVFGGRGKWQRPDGRFLGGLYRDIKSRIKPMLGFQPFRTAAKTIAGVELMQCIRKGQFTLDVLCVTGKTAPEIWNAVLAAGKPSSSRTLTM